MFLARLKGIFDPRTEQVYVIARNAENLDDGIRTALHESVGHKGLRNVLGSDLNPTPGSDLPQPE